MFGIGVQELLVILLIVLVLFGAKRLPELAKGMGTALREFKKAAKDIALDDVISSGEKPDETPYNVRSND
jgi:sec-independent protein translocase protein TatA